MDVERLKKMVGSVRTGGKGSMRRKRKGVHKAIPADDKKLQSTLNRFRVHTIQSIEEVNIFKDDVVIQFLNPKVQASQASNLWVVSGSAQTKKLIDVLPQMYQHLGAENMEAVNKIQEQYQRQAPGGRARATLTPLDEDSDDDIPELVGDKTFEAAAESDAESDTESDSDSDGYSD